MVKKVLIVLVVIALAMGAWFAFGGFDRWGATRIETELVARGVPQPMAECMAVRMVDRLTPNQLRKLGELRSQEGESALPSGTAELLERLRRIDDREVLEVTATSAAICAFGMP